MLFFIRRCWEYVFPERDDHKLVRLADTEDLLRLVCPTNFGEFVALLDFKEPLVRAAVHEAKFKGNDKAWNMLALVLEQYLKHLPADTTVIPVPLSAKRARKRGYNQTYEVAKRAMKQTPHLKLDPAAIYRHRDTVPQTKLPRADRLKNIEDAFRVTDAERIRDARIVILDDVATTGATLKAARAELARHGPSSITLLSLAH